MMIPTSNAIINKESNDLRAKNPKVLARDSFNIFGPSTSSNGQNVGKDLNNYPRPSSIIENSGKKVNYFKKYMEEYENYWEDLGANTKQIIKTTQATKKTSRDLEFSFPEHVVLWESFPEYLNLIGEPAQ